MVQTDGRVAPSEQQSPLVAAAHRLAARIEALVDEVTTLRAENEALRAEVRAAVTLLDAAAAGSSDGYASGHASRRVARPTKATSPRRRRRGNPPRGRATPAEVTPDVVRAVLVKLGESTASEIAAEITLAGAPVGGRAVRFLAERAGATTRLGEDGQRRYRLG